MARQASKSLFWLGLCLLAAGLSSCRRRTEVFSDVNAYLRSPQDVRRLDRVVFVELADGAGYPSVARDVTRALYKSIQARRLFHVDVVARDDPLCRDILLDKREAFTLEELARLQDELHCDALLFGKVTQFLPYPQMQIGLYLRLLDLREGRLVWGVDHLWNMTNTIVEDRAERFFKYRMRDLYGPADSNVLLMSPSAFERFVAYEVAATLGPLSADEERDEKALVAKGRRRDFVEFFGN